MWVLYKIIRDFYVIVDSIDELYFSFAQKL